jgi:hypothetical protein
MPLRTWATTSAGETAKLVHSLLIVRTTTEAETEDRADGSNVLEIFTREDNEQPSSLALRISRGISAVFPSTNTLIEYELGRKLANKG